MGPVVVVGSGASGVHFALSALEKGCRVLMIDVGRRGSAPVQPAASLHEMRAKLEDPVDYFLGKDFESLILPGNQQEYYGFPPSKSYVFEKSVSFDYQAHGFSPLTSFAAGGLAEAWTGGCYPLTEDELVGFPFDYRDIAPYYEKVMKRIGVSGADDDMTAFFPYHGQILPPLQLDEHSQLLLDGYNRHKKKLNSKFRCYLGRSRVAVLSQDLNGRKACSYLGRCLWGCPSESLYTPSVTLRQCKSHDNFQYVRDLCVSHFNYDASGRVRSVVANSVNTGNRREIDVGHLVLAAGTLSSSKIFMESIYRNSGELIELPGLMDNRQIMMPFVNLRMIGRRFNPDTYQYNQIAVGLAADDPRDHVHGLITTLKTALIHPLAQSIPTSLGTALRLLRNLHAALGLVNINFSDNRRDENRLGLEVIGRANQTRLRINYRPERNEASRIKRVLKSFRGILRTLGCIAPRRMIHVRPMGASVHYAGTIPMTSNGNGPSTDETCRSRDFENLYFVDGTTMPSLSAKNLTFTLMANAARVADVAF